MMFNFFSVGRTKLTCVVYVYVVSVMRRPRLQETTFVNDDGESKTLSDDQVDELKAIDSFWNCSQNWHGPPAVAGHVDITTTTREDFLTFLGHHDHPT